MSNNKSLLMANLKKTLAAGLPVLALSGFVPGATFAVDTANAESKSEAVVSEAKAKATSEAKSEAEAVISEAKSEAATAEAKAEAEAKPEAKAEAEAEAKKY